MKTKELKYEDMVKLFTVDVDGVVRWNVNKSSRDEIIADFENVCKKYGGT